jgi:hypothetical protein
MIENIPIPDIVKKEVGNEKIEFFVKAKKEQPTKNSLSVISYGFFSVLVISLIFSGFVWELFFKECTTLWIDGIQTKVCLDDLSPLKTLFVYYIVLLTPAIICFILGIFGLFKTGGYYVGTKSKLIRYSWGKIKLYSWESFTNDIEVFGNRNNGNIIFKLKTGVYTIRNDKKIFSNTKINIGDIIYAFEIEKYCRNRIIEMERIEIS